MIDVHTTRSVFIVTLTGEVDLAAAPALTATLTTALAGEWAAIVVECNLLGFIDVVGTRPLALARRAAQERGMAFYLLHPSRQMQRVLTLFELGDAVVPEDKLSIDYRDQLRLATTDVGVFSAGQS